MNPRFNLRFDEAKQMEAEGRFADIRLLSKQPPDGFIFDICYKVLATEYAVFNPNDWHSPSDRVEIKLTYPSGLYRCTEPWKLIRSGYKFTKNIYWATIEYKDGTTKRFEDRSKFLWATPVGRWYPSSTMPAKAIRYPNVKIDTVVKRVGELTVEEIELIQKERLWFFESKTPKLYSERDKIEFITHWNNLHAKPILTKDKTGYVCYPYDIDGWINSKYCNIVLKEMLMKEHYKGAIYKGKLLTIHADPVVQFITGERK